MITLYIATHNITGLKYFGKSSIHHSDEELQRYYHGSGTYWKRHLKKHGNDVTMKVWYQDKDQDACINLALMFSENYNIVKSKKWANLVIEDSLYGRGVKGHIPHNKGDKGKISFSDDINMSKGRSGQENARTNIWYIYDKKDNLVHTITEGLDDYCDKNSLPIKSLYKSSQKNGKPIYLAQPWQTPKKFKKYTGWYMKKEQK